MDNFDAIEAAYVTFVAEHQAAMDITVHGIVVEVDEEEHLSANGVKLGQNWTTVEEGQHSTIYDEHYSKIPALKEAYENAQH